MSDFWEQLSVCLHPDDRPAPACWRRHYQTKYDLARRRRPRTLCEIGVRAGYSAWAFLLACPDSWLLGIDNNSNTHGGVVGMIEHARRLLAGRAFALMCCDSQTLTRLPCAFDLVHVDGDHSYAGTLHDLGLAWDASGAVLIDDYHSIADVRQACDDFFGPRRIVLEHLDDKQVLAVRPCPSLTLEGAAHE